MKKILYALLLVSSISFAQVSQRCPVCPPSLNGVTDGWCLQDSAGFPRWRPCGGSSSLTNGLATYLTNSNSKVNLGGSLTRNANVNPAGFWIGFGDSAQTNGLYYGNGGVVGIGDTSAFFIGQDFNLAGFGFFSATFDLSATISAPQIGIDGVGESIVLNDGINIGSDTFNINLLAGDATTEAVSGLSFRAKDLDSANTAGFLLQTVYNDNNHTFGFLSHQDSITGNRMIDWFWDNDTVDVARISIDETYLGGGYKHKSTNSANVKYSGWSADRTYYSFGLHNPIGYLDPYDNIDFTGVALSDTAQLQMLWSGDVKFGIDSFGAISLPDTTFAPLTTQTCTITRTSNTINPAGTIAALTFVFPATPNNGQRIELSFTQIVTLITWPASVHATVATTVAAGGAIKLKYNSTLSKWVND